jgi:hypothetical protein
MAEENPDTDVNLCDTRFAEYIPTWHDDLQTVLQVISRPQQDLAAHPSISIRHNWGTPALRVRPSLLSDRIDACSGRYLLQTTTVTRQGVSKPPSSLQSRLRWFKAQLGWHVRAGMTLPTTSLIAIAIDRTCNAAQRTSGSHLCVLRQSVTPSHLRSVDLPCDNLCTA